MNARATFDLEGTYAALWHAERAAYIARPPSCKRSADPQLASRTARMAEAFRLRDAGHGARAIADAMGLGVETVKEYLRAAK